MSYLRRTCGHISICCLYIEQNKCLLFLLLYSYELQVESQSLANRAKNMEMYLVYLLALKLEVTVGQLSESRRFKLHNGMLKIVVVSRVHRGVCCTLVPVGRSTGVQDGHKEPEYSALQLGRRLPGPSCGTLVWSLTSLLLATRPSDCYHLHQKKQEVHPGWVVLGVGVFVPYIKRLQVQSPIGAVIGAPIHVSLSHLSLFLPLFLSPCLFLSLSLTPSLSLPFPLSFSLSLSLSLALPHSLSLPLPPTLKSINTSLSEDLKEGPWNLTSLTEASMWHEPEIWKYILHIENRV